MAGTQFNIVVLSSSPPTAPEPAAAAPRNAHPTPSRQRVAMPPSSPLVFSSPTSPKIPLPGASKINSRAAPIPEGAVRGFATVGSLVRSAHFVNELDDERAEEQQARSRRGSLEDTGDTTEVKKKPQKRSTKKTPADGSEKPKPKPRARKPKADKTPAQDPELRLPAPTESPFFADEHPEPPIVPQNEVVPKLTKSGKPRKPRAKKQKVENDDVELESKPKKTRVTKPKGAGTKGKVQRDDGSTVSAHFHNDLDNGEAVANDLGAVRSADIQNVEGVDASIWEVPQSPRPKKKVPPKQRPLDPIAEGLDLEEAVTRRRDWTPPRDTTIQSPFTDSVGKENRQLAHETNDTFTHMLSNFAYAQSPSVQATRKATDSTTEVIAATKRRRVELVQVPSNQTDSRTSSPEKGKAPKKKARTITDLVTGQYAPRDLSPDPNAITSNFFDPKSTTTKLPLNDVSAPNPEAPPKKPPRKRVNTKSGSEKAESKAKSKRGSTKSAAKSKPIAEKLLSPASALLRMNRQDVLFGTSSQLALEESPTMVRQLQLAIKESEQDVDHPPDVFLAAPPRWPKLGKSKGKRGLWEVSARDEAGGLLEEMEDVYIPEPDRTQDIPLLMDSTHDEPDVPSTFVDIEDLDAPRAVVISSDIPTPPRMIPQASQNISLATSDYPLKDVVFEDIDNFEQEPPPSNQNADSQHSFADIDDFDFSPAAETRASPPPKLRPPVSVPGDGSPKKRRTRSPKSKSAISTEVASSIPALKPSTSRPKSKSQVPHPPSTPPKASGRFIDIEEILDSEDEALEALSPTPPRVRKLQNSPPLPLMSLNDSPTTSPAKGPNTSALASISCIPTSHLEWVNIKPSVFASITAYIRSLPPTTDPKKPSWHEKILMYDPIVLEDFTAYLNANTRIRTYRKATQKQVKAWNSELKRKGEAVLNVGQSGEEVLAIERELETYMVQAWCESMSVCCIWGEGRGKGGGRKSLY